MTQNKNRNFMVEKYIIPPSVTLMFWIKNQLITGLYMITKIGLQIDEMALNKSGMWYGTLL